MTAPVLSGDALAAVRHRGSHLQIIASAGSGKTEVVAQRFAELMADGADPASMIAFTFTERAARELKARISARVEELIGPQALDRLGAAFVGTIHAYCFRLLQQQVPRYETFDVLDERRLTAFLCREEPARHLRDLSGRVFTSIKAFLENLEVVENELISLSELDDPFKAMAGKFCQLLEEFRLLACGQPVSRAVAELGKPDVAGNVHAALEHLIVDEYQDVNPAPERLIRLLTHPQVDRPYRVVGGGQDGSAVAGVPSDNPAIRSMSWAGTPRRCAAIAASPPASTSRARSIPSAMASAWRAAYSSTARSTISA
jgi:DNA helicase II / ATP-dependent DNA helicase PcrA